MPELVLCKCKHRGTLIEADPESQTVSLVHFVHGIATKPLRLFDRLRWCWRIFFLGRPYVDQIVLSPNKANALAAALEQASEAASTDNYEIAGEKVQESSLGFRAGEKPGPESL